MMLHCSLVLMLLCVSSSRSMVSFEKRADGISDSLGHQKVDGLFSQLNDTNSTKARLTQENFDLQHQVQELDFANAALAKAKSQLQAQNEDLKTNLHDDRMVQLSQLQVNYNNLSHRYDEESEAASTLRTQLSKVNSEFAALNARFEKELMVKTEELEELRRRLGYRINQLEKECETLRASNNNLEKKA